MTDVVATTTAATLNTSTTVALLCQNGAGSTGVYLPRITAIRAGSVVITGDRARNPARAPAGPHGIGR